MAKTKTTTAQKTELKVVKTEEVQRDTTELLGLYMTDELDLTTLTPSELAALIDRAAELEDKRKTIAKEVDAVVSPTKKLLLEVAKASGKKVLNGKTGTCKIGASSTTHILGTPTEFAALLKKEGKLELFDSLVGIRLGDTKKYLGEDALKDFVKVETEEYGTVSIGSKKK